MIRKRLKLLTGLIVLILFFAVYEFSSAFEAGTCEKGAENCDQPNGSPVLNAVEGVASIVDEDRRFESDTEEDINVLITFANAEGKTDFQNKFAVTVSSLFRFSNRHIVLYILGDKNSQEIAAQIIAKEVQDSSKYKLKSLDIEQLALDLEAVIRPMQEQFSYKPGAYYSHALFFMSVTMHRVLPNVRRIIMLDADLKFTDDIAKLYAHFDRFKEENVLGIAREGQPVYRHTFWAYRESHPGTRVGEPPPDGLTGFNSGVLLLNLDRMRKSAFYNELLTAESIKRISEEFGFKGHLGDQDFFTLIGMKYEQIIYVLPCQWNRQLCQWWRDKGYADVFDMYFNCDMDIKIYHGNCNTPIP